MGHCSNVSIVRGSRYSVSLKKESGVDRNISREALEKLFREARRFENGV